jgi:hypothetical protein
VVPGRRCAPEKLKRMPPSPDTAAMIFPAEAPAGLECRAPLALYVSLNRPVVALESLPVGPASATVALHQGGAALAVRSARTGQLVWFASGEELRESPRVALDAALSFAESMGFLFDDEAVEADAEAATRRWQDLLDGETRDEGPPGRPAAAKAPPELLLEDIVEPESGLVGPSGDVAAPEEDSDPDSALTPPAADLEPEAPPLPETACLPDATPALLLSKFRRVDRAEGVHAAAQQALERADDPDLRLRMISRF